MCYQKISIVFNMRGSLWRMAFKRIVLQCVGSSQLQRRKQLAAQSHTCCTLWRLFSAVGAALLPQLLCPLAPEMSTHPNSAGHSCDPWSYVAEFTGLELPVGVAGCGSGYRKDCAGSLLTGYSGSFLQRQQQRLFCTALACSGRPGTVVPGAGPPCPLRHEKAISISHGFSQVPATPVLLFLCFSNSVRKVIGCLKCGGKPYSVWR